jgi:excisionase family DNA binding protein
MLDMRQVLIYNVGMVPKLLTTTEAAEAIGVTRATLHAWIKRGRVKPPKLQIGNGHAVRLWSASDVARLRGVKKTIKVGRPKKI